MDTKRERFVLLVQTAAMIQAILDNRGHHQAVKTVMYAAEVPIDRLSWGELPSQANEFVDYHMQPSGQTFPEPRWLWR